MNSVTGKESANAAALIEQASAWDARLRAPDCTDAERAKFAAWRDVNPAHREAFERLQTIVATLHHERGRADLRALRDEALRVVRHRRRVWFATAAAILVALIGGIAVWKSPGSDWLSDQLTTLAAQVSGTQTFATSIGQRSTFVLVDGSSIELNARSRVKVRYSEARRDVELIEGQALFNVAKDPRRPFAVQAGDREVLAVGTRFDVRLDDTSVQVTLLEGKVRVEESSAVDDLGASSKRQEIELTPGKQLVAKLSTASRTDETASVSNGGPGEGANVVRDIDVAKVTGWREGRIYFDDLSLEDAVREMNLHSTVRIRIASPELAGLRVNGMFKAGEQEIFVSALQEYFPIATQRLGTTEIILMER